VVLEFTEGKTTKKAKGCAPSPFPTDRR